MDRLTTQANGEWIVLGDQQAAIDLLAAYENTGLEPKQVQKISNVFRQFGEEYNCWFDYVVDFVCKYAKAEQDGRLVVLPCRVGGTVYRVVTTRDCLPILSELKIKTIGQAVDLIEKIGKHRVLSYYLTREEAEAALKENAR